MCKAMESIEKGITFVAQVYGLRLPGPGGRLAARLAALGDGVRVVRFEITCRDADQTLLSYEFLPRVFGGFVPLVVPIREAESGRELDWRIAVERDESPECPASWRKEQLAALQGACLCNEGMRLRASRDLYSRGVISDYSPQRQCGFIRSGARLLFLKKWMAVETIPQIGTEVEFLPIAEIMKGLQARMIRPC